MVEIDARNAASLARAASLRLLQDAPRRSDDGGEEVVLERHAARASGIGGVLRPPGQDALPWRPGAAPSTAARPTATYGARTPPPADGARLTAPLPARQNDVRAIAPSRVMPKWMWLRCPTVGSMCFTGLPFLSKHGE